MSGAAAAAVKAAKKTAIGAAMDLAEDIAMGRVDVAELRALVAAECRELFATVVGPGDALWELHVDVARQAVALGALSGDELAEWAHVFGASRGEPEVSWIERVLAAGADDEGEGDA